jgi:putative glutamine amidotransferase
LPPTAVSPVEASLPVVGVSSGFTDYGDYIGVAYSRPLMRVAALPLILPYLDSAQARADVLARVDALVFGVGRDIEPHRYGARSHPSMTARSAVRDEFELALIRDALDRGVPVLGICRGAQLLNVALGGTLYRDRSEYPPAARSHPGGDWDRWDLVCAAALGRAEAPIHPAHPINIAPDSLLAQALGTKAIVNSYHHQAMRSLGRGARPVAWAPDGIVEAIEVRSAPAPCIGVQWEVQESWKSDERFLNIFRILLNRN